MLSGLQGCICYRIRQYTILNKNIFCCKHSLQNKNYKIFHFDNNTDPNKLAGAHFYWNGLTVIVSQMFVLTIIKNTLLYYLKLYIDNIAH